MVRTAGGTVVIIIPWTGQRKRRGFNPSRQRFGYSVRSRIEGEENCFLPRRNTEGNGEHQRRIGFSVRSRSGSGRTFFAPVGVRTDDVKKPWCEGTQIRSERLLGESGPLGTWDMQSPERPVCPSPRCAGGVLAMPGQTVNRAIVFQSLRRARTRGVPTGCPGPPTCPPNS